MITGTLTGKVRSFLVYASPDGKACLAVAEILQRLTDQTTLLDLSPVTV